MTHDKLFLYEPQLCRLE